MTTKKKKKERMFPAIPPEDYKGCVSDWMMELVDRDLWDDSDGSWYGDIIIPESVYHEILTKCENI